MHTVILAGGSGTRLWPLSREQHPKQFLALNGSQTLLQQSVLRAPERESVTVVCAQEQRFTCAQQLLDIGVRAQIVLESEAKNTAPALALAALSLRLREGSEALMLVLPADHAIDDIEVFKQAIARSVQSASDGAVVCFGAAPDSAHTGYGYLKCPSDLLRDSNAVMRLLGFEEKPSAQRAAQLLHENSGGHGASWLWNCGIYLLRVDTYLSLLQQHASQVLSACELAMAGAVEDCDFIRPCASALSQSPSISIDYAVMEPHLASPAANACVTVLGCPWSDLGSWSALSELGSVDERGNRLRGDVMSVDTDNCYVMAEQRLIATVGVRDLIVIDTPDALLVADRASCQAVSRVVAELKRSGRVEAQHQRKVYRPWGSFELLKDAAGFSVKHLSLNPGASISLQRHRHRAEHWVLVSGRAQVQKAQRCFELLQNQSVYIAPGEIHRLSNPTTQVLELIEVQTGEILSESDIERLADDYGR
ncbi:MAG: mannose-1-phosphate guanylyltransferase/mannose-6-phosphate isomerase [Pseudomonadales bacterium]